MVLWLFVLSSGLLYGENLELERKAKADLYSARFLDAANEYRSLINENPQWAPGYYGLVRALLQSKRAAEAYVVAEEGLRLVPAAAETQTAAGLAAYRKGDLANAENYFKAAYKIDPAYPGALAGIAQIYQTVGKNKSAGLLIDIAHKTNPHDPAFLRGSNEPSFRRERIAQLEESFAQMEAEGTAAKKLKARISELKSFGDRVTKRLSSPYQPYELTLTPLMADAKNVFGMGVRVRFNQKQTLTLLVDTGAGGVSISPKAAEKIGLESVGSGGEAYGIGDERPQDAFNYRASEIRIGDLTFADYPVDGFKSARSADIDGIIGLDVFRQFLVTLDLLHRRVVLTPFATMPGAVAEDAPQKPPIGFIKTYLFGAHFTVPVMVNKEAPRLFLLDSGSTANLVDLELAKTAAKVHAEAFAGLKGLQGKVTDVAKANTLTLTLPGFRQENSDVYVTDMRKVNDAEGFGLGGIIGTPNAVAPEAYGRLSEWIPEDGTPSSAAVADQDLLDRFGIKILAKGHPPLSLRSVP